MRELKTQITDSYLGFRNTGVMDSCKIILSGIPDIIYPGIRDWCLLFGAKKDHQLNSSSKPYKLSRLSPTKKLFQKLEFLQNDVFLDVGCGMGHIMALASHFPFKSIRGIELSKTLCRKAEVSFVDDKRDLGKYQFWNGDALEYKIKEDETIFYLYDPFDFSVFLKILENIQISYYSKPRRIIIIYYNNLISDFEFIKEYPFIMDFTQLNILGNRYAVFSTDKIRLSA